MSDRYVHVVTPLESEPQHAEKFAGIMRQFTRSGRAAPGNRRFSAYQNTSAPQEFVVLETWEDEDSADNHLSSDYLEQTFQAMGPLLTSPSAITRYVRVI